MDRHSQLFEQAQIEADIARGHDLVFIRWMQSSLRGDPSLVPLVAHQIGTNLIHEDHISANERIWLALMLAKIANSPEAARVISGSGKGAPKNGLRSDQIAAEVMNAIFDGASSVEAAIAQVSAKRHMTTDAVSKHWKSNQDVVWDLYGEVFREIGFADLRDTVKQWTAANRRNPDVASQPWEDGKPGK